MQKHTEPLNRAIQTSSAPTFPEIFVFPPNLIYVDSFGQCSPNKRYLPASIIITATRPKMHAKCPNRRHFVLSMPENEWSGRICSVVFARIENEPQYNMMRIG